MSYGRSDLYANGDVAERGDVAAAPVLQRSMDTVLPQGASELDTLRSIKGGASELDTLRSIKGGASELDTLRSINAHLVREIAILKQREAQALRLADRDGLTGLYNRRRMAEFLSGAIAEASQQGERFGLLFIDLDGFKHSTINTVMRMGDELLMTVTGRIAARARTGDLVCRYGGDEFIVLLPRVPDRAAALDVAAAIADLVALPYRLGGEELRVTAAIGVSVFPDDGHNAAELLRRADRAHVSGQSRDASHACAHTSPCARPTPRR